MEFEKVILIGIVIFLASVLQGIFGFAFMLIAMPLVSFILDIRTTVPLLALVSFSVSLIYWFLVLRLPRSEPFHYKKIMPLFAGASLGIPIGVSFLIQFDERLIKLILGIVLILYSIYSLFYKRIIVRLPDWTGYIFGFFSGLMGGAFNIGGPPVVFYISTKEWSKIDIISSLSLFYVVASTLIMLFHIWAGNITGDIVVTFLEILPAEFIGMLLGTSLFRRISEDKYRKGIFALLIVMGMMLMM